MKTTYNYFKEIMLIIMNTDNVNDVHLIEDHLNDWYTLYKGTAPRDGILGIVCWAKEQFNPMEVNKNTHDFWLDNRGVEIALLKDAFINLSPSTIFPTY